MYVTFIVSWSSWNFLLDESNVRLTGGCYNYKKKVLKCKTSLVKPQKNKHLAENYKNPPDWSFIVYSYLLRNRRLTKHFFFSSKRYGQP